MAAQHPYGVLAEAMQQAGRGALGQVVLSSQRQLVLVHPGGRLLVLDVLHYPAQVRSPAGYAAELTCPAATAAERTLARQLLALASAPLDPAAGIVRTCSGNLLLVRPRPTGSFGCPIPQ
jgi:non-homologous end joining protein Ku